METKLLPFSESLSTPDAVALAREWYNDAEVLTALANAGGSDSPGSWPAVPRDVHSREFALWLADHLRRAAARGASLAHYAVPAVEKVAAFTVFGVARPAGSKGSFVQRRKDGSIVMTEEGRPIIRTKDSSGEKGRDWREAVASASREAYKGELLEGPLAVVFRFVTVRPAGHYRTNGLLRPSAPAYPITRPDTVKLARAAEDALTKVLWGDDSQIVRHVLEKIYGEPARLEVEVYRL